MESPKVPKKRKYSVEKDDNQIRHIQQIKTDIRKITTKTEFVKFIKTCGPIDIDIEEIVLRGASGLYLIDANLESEHLSFIFESRLSKIRQWENISRLVTFLYNNSNIKVPKGNLYNLVTCKIKQNRDGESKIETMNLGEWLYNLSDEDEEKSVNSDDKCVDNSVDSNADNGADNDPDIMKRLQSCGGEQKDKFSNLGLTILASVSYGLKIPPEKVIDFFSDVLELSNQYKSV
jgi:hypothetical protein